MYVARSVDGGDFCHNSLSNPFGLLPWSDYRCEPNNTTAKISVDNAFLGNPMSERRLRLAHLILEGSVFTKPDALNQTHIIDTDINDDHQAVNALHKAYFEEALRDSLLNDHEYGHLALPPVHSLAVPSNEGLDHQKSASLVSPPANIPAVEPEQTTFGIASEWVVLDHPFFELPPVPTTFSDSTRPSELSGLLDSYSLSTEEADATAWIQDPLINVRTLPKALGRSQVPSLPTTVNAPLAKSANTEVLLPENRPKLPPTMSEAREALSAVKTASKPIARIRKPARFERIVIGLGTAGVVFFGVCLVFSAPQIPRDYLIELGFGQALIQPDAESNKDFLPQDFLLADHGAPYPELYAPSEADPNPLSENQPPVAESAPEKAPEQALLGLTNDVRGLMVQRTVKLGEVKPATEASEVGDNFSFPELTINDDGNAQLTIKDEPIPARSVRRLLEEGNGGYLMDGDEAQVSYELFSWSTGELVHSSGDEGVSVTIGNRQNKVGEDGKPLPPDLPSGDAAPIPDYVHQSLLHRTQGSKLQVVLEKGAEGLPEGLNPNDGYVVIVNIN